MLVNNANKFGTIFLPCFQKNTMGFPSPAADYSEQRINLNDLIRHPVATYFFEVDNDSMKEAFIPPRSRLVVDRSVRPANGSIVVAIVNGEYVIRRLKVKGTERLLVADSEKIRPVRLEEDVADVWGVVTYIIINAREV
jgi:DNA polymerase V